MYGGGSHLSLESDDDDDLLKGKGGQFYSRELTRGGWCVDGWSFGCS